MTDSIKQKSKVGVIFLGRKRPGFDMEWGSEMEARVRSWLSRGELDIFEPSEKAVDERSLHRIISECKNQDVNALVLLQTTMGDGRLAPDLAQLWPDPVVLWATPEKPDGDMISSCSLVGTHCWASVLRQMGHSFELVYGDPEAEGMRQKFNDAVRLVTTIRGLRSVRLGLIGGQAPGYFAMSADPFVIHRGLGAQIQTYSLIEFSNIFQNLSEEAVSEDVEVVKAMGLPLKDVTEDDLPVASRMYLTMRAFIENENLDALTIRCWPEMANTFGQWPYLGVARLSDEGFSIAIEGDADAALTAWIIENLGLGRCYLSDWLEHDHDSITLWHVGAAPFSLCMPVGEKGGPQIARHFNIRKPAVVEATLMEDIPVTIARFWRFNGQYYLTAREGQTIRPKRHLMATNGLVKLSKQDPGEWFEELCYEGMPHHVVLFQGHYQSFLKRFARVMNIHYI